MVTWLLIGGLTQHQDAHANTGLSFLPRWMAGAYGLNQQNRNLAATSGSGRLSVTRNDKISNENNGNNLI
jgi:hypothetical protein